MQPTWRLLAVTLAASVVSGCGVNRVRSVTPLFVHVDAVRLKLRPGVWASPSEDCAFDPESSVKSWPACAESVHVRGDELYRRVSSHGLVIESLLAAGDPMILQTHIHDVAGKGGFLYEYEAVHPLRYDVRGRVVAYERWWVVCGPVREEVAPDPDGPPAPITPEQDELPPGVVRHPKKGCLAHDAQAVRQAATITRERAWTEPYRGYWVRPFRFRDHFAGGGVKPTSRLSPGSFASPKPG